MVSRRAGLVLLPLGGASEIGMNCYLYGTGDPDDREWLMVDLGVKFGEESEPGIDIVLPDLSFIEAERRSLAGIVLTHAHEDHLGALPWLWRRLGVPVHCTPFAAALLRNKLEEFGLAEEVPIEVRPVGSRFSVGPFEVEFIGVTHSIPEPTALLIRTKEGSALHSGDWKIDRRPSIGPDIDEARFRALGETGIDAFVCDSTNVLREGHSPSEADVAATLDDIVARAPRRVAITTFASHVGRITSAVLSARRAGRDIVVAGRAMRTVIEAARATGYLRMAGEFLDEEAFGYLPPERVMLLCTGSQGEPRAALARIAEDTHPNVALEEGDIVIFSSRTIPGNEKAVSTILNNLAKLGVDAITSDDALVHTSGHPRRGELRDLYGWLKPRAVVPVHGEPRHLRAQALFARSCGVPDAVIADNGSMIRLAPGPVTIIDEAPAGRLHVDGRLIVPAEDGPARHRRRLSFAGIIVASLVIDRKDNLLGDPQITVEGLSHFDGEGREFAPMLADVAAEAFESTPRPRRRDVAALSEALRVALRRTANEALGKKPVCRVVIHRV
ncbi:MAG: ribonuclease J [Hyphomicrobiales bacterium]